MKESVIVSDTSPLNYLVLIGGEELLTRLFIEVLIPLTVARELSHPKTPASVRAWIAAPLSWLRIAVPSQPLPSLGLDPGETEAIPLAQESGVTALLIDERRGFRVAEQPGLKPIGLLGVLEVCASRGWIDFGGYANRLRTTTFRFQERLIAEISHRLATKRG